MADDALFPIGVPAGEGHVVDREDFVESLTQQLSDRVSVVLSAPRRTGKTSVALEVLRRLNSAGVHTAAIDLAGVLSLEEFADGLSAECLRNLPLVGRLSRAIGRSWRELLARPEIRLRLHDLELAASLRDWEDADPWQKVNLALALPELIGERTGRRFVVMMDEFQLVRDLGAAALLRRMRSVFQLQQHTAFLFLGSQGSLMHQLFESAREPFFRYAVGQPLPPVPDPAWRKYIRERLASRNRRIGEDALDAMLDATGGHPYDTMEVAYYTHLLARERPDPIDRACVLAAVDQTEDLLQAVFQAEIEALGPKARLVLGRLAHARPVYTAEDRSQSALRAAVRELLQAGVLVRHGRGRYAFGEPMLARHLRRT